MIKTRHHPHRTEKPLFIARSASALEEERADLPLELTDGPITLETFVFLESTLEGIIEPKELDDLRPREAEEQARRQCGWR